MFVGHFALAFGAKRAAPAVSLGAMIFACQFADLLWPILVIAGAERVAIEPGATAVTPLNFISYPYSHSLVALVGWGVLAGLVYVIVRSSPIATGATIGLLVVSHWLLDVIAHRPDMPVTVTGTTRVGLGLWNSRPATVLVESLMLVVGTALYIRTTAARDRIGSIGFWSLLGLLLLIYAGAVAGPPPPDVEAVIYPALAMWLLVLWGHWVDRHRTARLR
jgi:hypothetical protein